MSSNSKASMTTLPQEIFDEVLSYIEDRADISSLSRTCKKLRSLTIHLVFENITMLWYDPEGKEAASEHDWDYDSPTVERFRQQNPNFTITDDGAECPRLDLLVRSILENPECGRLVETINLQCFGHRYNKAGFRKAKPKLASPSDAEEYRDLLMKAMMTYGSDLSPIKEQEQFEAGLQKNRIDYIVGLLILACPNVTSLTLGAEFLRDDHRGDHLDDGPDDQLEAPALDFIFRNCASRLQNLTCIKLGASLESCTWPLFDYGLTTKHRTLSQTSYLTLFFLPKLEEADIPITIHDASPYRERRLVWPGGAPPSSPSPVKTLLLPTCGIEPTELRGVLQYTPNITRLEYDWKPMGKAQGGFQRNAEELASALFCVKDTLKHFKFGIFEWNWGLDDIYEAGYYSGNMEFESIIGHCSLKQLHKLETVTIPACVLLGWLNRKSPKLIDVLPENLVSLSLTNDFWEHDTYQQSGIELRRIFHDFLSGNWKEHLPRLKEFNWLCEPNWPTVDAIETLFRDHGLDCQIHGLDCQILEYHPRPWVPGDY